MNSFVDLKKIYSYSIALAEKMTADFYANKSKAEAADIKSFSKIEQLNLLIIKNLFEKWQEETQKLRSPYFDYSSQQVQSSLKNLLNTLSNHISISREFFKPLLEKAIQDTLLLAFDPLTYITKEVISSNNVISVDKIKSTHKFYRTNVSYFDFIRELFSSSGKDSLNAEFILTELKKQRFQTGGSQNIIDHFSDLLKLEINEILIEPTLAVQEEKAAIREAASSLPAPDTNSFFDIPSESSPKDPAPLAFVKDESAISPQAPETTDKGKPVEKPETAKPLPNEEPVAKEANPTSHTELTKAAEEKQSEEELTINQRFQRQEKTLYDLISSSKDLVKGEKVSDLRSAIPLHERFIYIKELFNDDPSAFAVAVAELEKAADLNSALEIIKINYTERFNWDLNSPCCNQFIQLVERRFL